MGAITFDLWHSWGYGSLSRMVKKNTVAQVCPSNAPQDSPANSQRDGGSGLGKSTPEHNGKVYAALPQQHGVLVLNKPSGPTSARCLTAIKRLGQKKIGHAGTLDPLASGVLLVLLGQATKLSGHLMAGGRKVYNGVLCLGQTTDTWDIEGKVIDEAPWQHIGEEDVRREVAAWLDLTEQPVPSYSAAKHEGQPLYKLARKGIEAPQKIKCMEISQADVLEISLPLVRFRVACSSGTYIRSLAHSLGSRLGCGAVLTELTREFSHPFGLNVARDPADFTADPSLLPGCVISVADALPHWPRVDLTPEEAARVRNGMAVPCQTPQADPGSGEDLAFLMEQGHALALAKREATDAGPCWAVLRGLWN